MDKRLTRAVSHRIGGALEHEYAVLGGLNRAAIGRYLSIAASAIAACLGTLVAWLIDIAKRFGLADNVPGLVLWPLTAGAIYMVLYWLFESRIWKGAPDWSRTSDAFGGPFFGAFSSWVERGFLAKSVKT